MLTTRSRVTAIPVLAAAGLVSSLPFALKAAAHQDHAASPEAAAATNPFADLGLPEITLTVTPEAYEGIPESLEAGRYALTVTGEAGPDDFLLGGMLIQLPEGTSIDDVIAQAQSSEMGAMPEVFYEMIFAGGKPALAAMGETSSVSVIDLTPGEWHVLDQTFTRAPLTFTVTGEMPAELAEPQANVTLEMGEMYFEITEGAFVAGENIVHLFNAGVQPHFAEILMVPDGTTNEDVETAIMADMAATPEAENVLAQAMPVAFLSEQSEGVSSWSSLTLEAGTYALTCWITDPETGMPHAMMGMHSVFVVE